MRFGACIGDDAKKIRLSEDLGYDYVECGFALFGKGNEEKYDIFLEEIKKHNIKCESANCFIPGSMKTTGDDIDYEALKEYIDYGMSRGVAVGLKTVVFGSGGSKEVPEGFSQQKAFSQLIYFLKEIVSPIAEKYDITVVTEPLSDCNIIQTVKEGVYLSAAVDKKNIMGLCDLFHMSIVGDTIEDVKTVKGSIGHAHIAEPITRNFPTDATKYDYKKFIDALEYVGCPRCSVEASTKEYEKDTALSIEVLKSCN